MPYFNGTLHGFNGPGGYVPARPTTAIYCDACAEVAIPLAPKVAGFDNGRRHHGTDFKWCGYFGGNTPCTRCGRPVDAKREASQ